ncbi:hypothetical protein JCM8547_005544 [Rhodosporidiobolus lusitaniae]
MPIEQQSAIRTPLSSPPSPASFLPQERSSNLHGDILWLEIRSPTLLTALKLVFPTLASLYTQHAEIGARAVYVRRKQLRAAAVAVEDEERETRLKEVNSLVQYLEERFAFVHDKIATFPPGTVSFDLAWTLFELDGEVESVHEVTGEKVALVLDSWDYKQEAMGACLNFSCHFLQWAGTSYHRVPATRKIREYKDLRDVSSLPVFPLSEESKASLAARGKLYQGYVGQHVHAKHEGFFFTRAFTGATRLLGNGQVIIDVTSFRRAIPTLDVWGDDVRTDDGRPSQWASKSSSTSQPCPPVSEDQLLLLPPTLHGFSIQAKRWGEFLVSRLSPISWRDESFSHLVIPSSYRRILKALVTVHANPKLKSQLMRDVVDGKGNGLVMILHGAPGTGKTLTAEAVAEHLRRPLYVVSASELGTTAAGLETQLTKALELATTWSAVLLIDEADIFLAKRDMHNLERNALVGIFLRLLEYFSGVLILTTNNIERFDEAFLSRSAVVLHFPELDKPSRQLLWERFLLKTLPRPSSSGSPSFSSFACPSPPPSSTLSHFDLSLLASHALNGREIKHAVQTAQAIALVEGEELGMRHVEEVIRVARSGWGGGVQGQEQE